MLKWEFNYVYEVRVGKKMDMGLDFWFNLAGKVTSNLPQK